MLNINTDTESKTSYLNSTSSITTYNTRKRNKSLTPRVVVTPHYLSSKPTIKRVREEGKIVKQRWTNEIILYAQNLYKTKKKSKIKSR